MKRSSFCLFYLFLLILQLSCKKDQDLKPGIITGFDVRNCGLCCGGLMINFEGKTGLYEGNPYMIENGAAELGLGPNTTFPVWCRVRYEVLPGCNGSTIRIHQFQIIR